MADLSFFFAKCSFLLSYERLNFKCIEKVAPSRAEKLLSSENILVRGVVSSRHSLHFGNFEFYLIV